MNSDWNVDWILEADLFNTAIFFLLVFIEFIVMAVVVHGAGLCLCPQRSGSCSGTLRETAAHQPSQVQLLPLCPGALWQTRPTCGGGEDCVCGLCWAWQGVRVHLNLFNDVYLSLCVTKSLRSLSIFTVKFLKPYTSHLKQYLLKQQHISNLQYFRCNQVLNLISHILSKAKHIEQLTATCLHKLYPQWADDVGLKKNI